MKFLLKVALYVILSLASVTITVFLEQKELAYKISDGLFLSSVILFLIGGLSAAANHGTFDGLAFGFKKLFNRAKNQTYFDYVQEKKAADKTQNPPVIFIIAALDLLGALLFTL